MAVTQAAVWGWKAGVEIGGQLLEGERRQWQHRLRWRGSGGRPEPESEAQSESSAWHELTFLIRSRIKIIFNWLILTLLWVGLSSSTIRCQISSILFDLSTTSDNFFWFEWIVISTFSIIITPKKVLQSRLHCHIGHFARLFWVCVCVSGHLDLECSALVLPLQQTCTQYSFWYQLSYIPKTRINTLSSPNSKDLFNMQGLLICRFHLRAGGISI